MTNVCEMTLTGVVHFNHTQPVCFKVCSIFITSIILSHHLGDDFIQSDLYLSTIN